MRHVPDGVLRRLDDEPLAVPDRVSEHLASCVRCTARRAQIAEDTESVAQALSAPQLAPDVEIAWARLRRQIESGQADGAVRRVPVSARPLRARFPSVSIRSALAVGVVGMVVAGTTAAATLTTIFAPTHVAPVSVSQTDLRAIAAITGLGDGQSPAGFSALNGSRPLRFGTVTWSSGSPHSASSVTQAATDAGFAVSLPADLPKGVGGVQRLSVQPRVRATVTFNSTASGLAGSSVIVDAGPGVVAQYGTTSGPSVTALAVVTLRRPTAQSTGAKLTQIEAFLLAEPGIPPQLAEEIRFLGASRTTLPVPVPPGASVHPVQIGRWPGVLLADSSNAAAGVIWEDGRGFLHAVVGILDSHDVLNVANQLR